MLLFNAITTDMSTANHVVSLLDTGSTNGHLNKTTARPQATNHSSPTRLQLHESQLQLILNVVVPPCDSGDILSENYIYFLLIRHPE